MGEASYSGGRLIGKIISKIGIWPICAAVVFGGIALVMSNKEKARQEAFRSAEAERKELQKYSDMREAERRACIEKMPALIERSIAELKAGDPVKARALVSSCLPDADGPEVQALLAKLKRADDAIYAKAYAEQQVRDKKAAAELKAKKKREGVQLGMTSQDVLDSSWGRPEKVNRTIGSFGTHEQWVYGDSYLYFENGILKTIQN